MLAHTYYIHSHHRKVWSLFYAIMNHYVWLVLCVIRVCIILNYTVFFTWSPALMSGTDSEEMPSAPQ